MAPKAAVKLIASASTSASDGVTLSAQYAVSNNVAPVLTLSYGSCELALGTSGNQFWNSLWQQAAAQGITVLVAAGDSGSAGCDNPSSSKAVYGNSVNALCSSPYSTCVGGTAFNDSANPSLYWSTSNSSTYTSALKYIPESVWNQSASVSGGSGLWAGGGGPSGIYQKPSWQAGAGVPADGWRDVPDVAMAASSYDGYVIEMNGGLYLLGGTSAATPSFAGVMALAAQRKGARLGNANPALYGFATRQAGGGAAVFHDITAGNNTVPGVTGFSAGTGLLLAVMMSTPPPASRVAVFIPEPRYAVPPGPSSGERRGSTAGARLGNANPALYGFATRQTGGGAGAVFHDITTGNNTVPGVMVQRGHGDCQSRYRPRHSGCRAAYQSLERRRRTRVSVERYACDFDGHGRIERHHSCKADR